MRICFGDAWEVSCIRKKLFWRFSPPKKVKNASWDILEVPAFAGMTMRGVGTGDSSLRWNRNAEPHDK